MKQAKRFIVSGIVQGVGFRYFALKTANSFGLKGYVKNLYDGSVEVYAIGTSLELENFKIKLEQGPSYSKVVRVFEEDTDIDTLCRSFSVRD